MKQFRLLLLCLAFGVCLYGIAGADLSIVVTGPATFVGNITYNIAVANAGALDAVGVIVTDVLPAGATFVSATPSQGSCSGTSTVSCSLGNMLNGASATIVLVVVGPSGTGTVVNTATVSSSTTDFNTANNTSTSTTTVATPSVPPSIPTLSTWGLAVLALLLMAAGCSPLFSRKARV